MIITPYPIYPDEVANFTLYDPIIPKGTIAVNTDEGDGRAKIGDGVNNWSDLPYIGGSTIGVVPVPTTMPVNNEMLRYSDLASSFVYTLQGMVDTQTNWETNNDVFPSFCILIETDDITDEVTGRVKFSDGVTTQDQIPWIWFNYDDWPTGYGIYYNGTTIDYKQFQEYNVLPFAPAPIGKYLKDDGTWDTPVITDYTFESIEADYASFGTVYIGDFPSETTTVTLTSDGTDLFIDGNKTWTQYNDGDGSGLDADTLDGHHYTYFATGPEVAVNNNLVAFGASPNILIDSEIDPATLATTTYVDDKFPIAPPITVIGNIVTFNSTNGLELTDSGIAFPPLSGNELKYLRVNSYGEALEFATISLGSGDVTGPEGATNGNFPLLDASGKILSDSTYSPNDFATSDHIHTTASEMASGFLPILENTTTKYLRDDGTWQPVSGSGLGDVTGPATSILGDLVVFNSTDGKSISDSGYNVNDFATTGDITNLVTEDDALAYSFVFGG